MSSPLLYLITPPIGEGRNFAESLRAALAAAPVAAVQLRFAACDERSMIKRVKDWAEIVQQAGAAAIIAIEPDPDLDLATIVTRAGADGLHLRDVAAAAQWRGRLKGERIVGVGSLRSRHDCMEAGEAELDYLMFGEPRADGSIPVREGAFERTAWWAEIFETPCVIFAETLAEIPAAVATDAEFVALGDAVFAHPEGPAAGVSAAAALLAGAARAESGT